METKTEKIDITRIATYVKFTKDSLSTGMVNDDWLKDILTAQLYGYIYEMAKEEDEIIVHIERPTFLDWLLRRRKKKVIKYSIKELVKIDKLVFPDNLRTIQIKIE